MSPVAAACPNCGATVEFRFDDTFVRVCAFCNAVVARSDRGFESLGKMGDLAASESPLALFASGQVGGVGFQLVGRAQIAHDDGGGWEEWYARFDDGRWGWLSESQGRFHLSFAHPAPGALPGLGSLAPGSSVTAPGPLGAPRSYTVSERASATYRAAAGEMPYRLEPGLRFRYVDLSAGGGEFATIDYGTDDEDPRALFVGHEVPLGDLHLVTGSEPSERKATTVSGRHVSCPQCKGSLELHAPDAAQRVTCPYCAALLDVDQGNLSYLRTLDKRVQRPDLPLGSKARFDGRDLTLIGCLLRSVNVEGVDYPFTEYLLHEPSVGYRWLVESSGHWNYVTPLAAGDVQQNMGGVTYRGNRFRHFQSARARVDAIFGEFYWKVELGDQVEMADYVRPPNMLSQEIDRNEVQWSIGVWLAPEDVTARITQPPGVAGSLQIFPAGGVAPNQPWRHRGIGLVTLVLTVALLAGTFAVAARSSEREVPITFEDDQLAMPAEAAAPAAPAKMTGAQALDKFMKGEMTADEYTRIAMEAETPPLFVEPPPADGPVASRIAFSKPFELEGGRNLEFALSSNVSNSWCYVAVDLIHDASGMVETFDAGLEAYSGIELGEYWSEGESSKKIYLAAVPAGTYLLRFERQFPSNKPANATLTLREGVFRPRWLLVALGVLFAIPFFVFLAWFGFEKRRWSESDHPWFAGMGSGDE